MNHFIKNIHINKLFHLENIDIPIADEKYPHLIITGKNGSGKTVLLNAVAEFIDNIKDLQLLSTKYESFKLSSDEKYKVYESIQPYWKKLSSDEEFKKKTKEKGKEIKSVSKADYKALLEKLLEDNSESVILSKNDQNAKKAYGDYYTAFLNALNSYNTKSYNSVFCDFTNNNIKRKIKNKKFVLAYYSAQRANSELKMMEPKSPTKPELNTNMSIKETYTNKFLEFLSDLKIQGALARNEKQNKDAQRIDDWFDDFVKLLQQIFQDNALKLEFDYRNYSFKICIEDKKFKFTELSDGFAAVIYIVADLILKMQDEDSLQRVYEKEGIVLIDEIETHLHLGLQKNIMPLLTQVFPNIQFIVTTHSPFVLSSMPNAVAYDLEHREVLDDLTEYSYESLAEGYFGVKTQSSYAEMQLNTLKELLGKEVWTEADKVEIKQLKSDFEKIPETISPLIVGEFRQIVIQNAEKLKNL